MVSIPFVVSVDVPEAIRHSFLLLLLNGVYIMRAKTEEWHLSKDPDYVAYAQWIDRHGVFRWIKHVPLLSYLSYKKPVS